MTPHLINLIDELAPTWESCRLRYAQEHRKMINEFLLFLPEQDGRIPPSAVVSTVMLCEDKNDGDAWK